MFLRKVEAGCILILAGLSLHAADLAAWVDPFVGTAGTGHCSPAAAYPFGMLQPGADTGNRGWDYCAGYLYSDRRIRGFCQTHLNGTGSTDLGDVGFFPFTGACPAELSSAFSHERECASPGYYAVELDDFSLKAEATCSERVAYWRFRASSPISIARLADYTMSGAANDKPTVVVEKRVLSVTPRRLEGWAKTTGWTNREYGYVVEFDRPVELDGDVWTSRSRELGMRVALSASSIEGARANLAAEGESWDFDAVRRAARHAWNRILARLHVPAETDRDVRKSLYTALYRVCFQPNLLSDAGEKPFYSTFSLWDTFRAAHPLYTEIVPEKVPLFVNSLLEQGRRNGYLPIWPLWGKETQGMIGTHSVPVIVDAYLKGFSGVDWHAAYRQIRETLTNHHPARRKEDWAVLDRYGYYPFDLVRAEGVSRLLECTYDDYCAGRMAEKLGHRNDAAFFYARAQGWTNVFDAATLFVRGKDSHGAWRTPFDPRAVNHNHGGRGDFTEGNAYQWTWHVLHDIAGLVARMGGTEAARERLDGLFAADSRLAGSECRVDVTGLIGQYAHGNEPSHHIPFIYAAIGRGDLAHERAKEICARFYRPLPDGLAGNDDCGQMSAWLIYAALGRYPLNPCSDAGYVHFPPVYPGVRIEKGTVQ